MRLQPGPAAAAAVRGRVTWRAASGCRNGDGTGRALQSSLLETIVKTVQIGGATRARGGSHIRLALSPHATARARTRPWYLQMKPPRSVPSEYVHALWHEEIGRAHV